MAQTSTFISIQTPDGNRVMCKMQNGEELVNTMVTEILRHPQQDFSQCLADKLGVGDLFEWFLMEQSSANKSSKEKVDTRHIK